MRRVDRATELPSEADPDCGLQPDDREAEALLRDAARSSSAELPLDLLESRFGLSELDQLALIAVAAPELDPAYGQLFGELTEGAEQQAATVAAVLAVTDGVEDRHVQRMALGPHGCLRRHGLVVASPDGPTDLHSRLGLAPGLLDLLLGSSMDVGAVAGDSDEVKASRVIVRASDWHRLEPIVEALDAGAIDLVGLWGLDEPFAEAWVTMVAAAMGRPVRRAPVGAWSEAAAANSFRQAGFLGALLWIPVDGLDEETRASALDWLGARLAATSQPVVLTAQESWRHPGAIAARRFAERTLPSVSVPDRAAAWRLATGERLTPEEMAHLATRWRLQPAQVRAAAAAAAMESSLDNREVGLADLDRAAAAVAAATSGRLVTAVQPRRGPDQLILPEGVHDQILELGRFARALPELADRWGFGRLMTGGAGLKALFVGEPGTGKTLAAEVVAGVVGAQLLRVDLSRAVSKWVGETSKHIEQIFEEAGSGHGVLFFDEADALFGKRGEVRHGTDRYANTEVSHLLQRFEQYDGLVILATNLRENIDPAFLRRFDTVTYFPRPTEPERRRLWRLAFPPEAPLDPAVDLDFLATLDFTGAGIAAAARMAGLLASADDAPTISVGHVLAGVSRQFRTEGRVLSQDELGPFAGSQEAR